MSGAATWDTTLPPSATPSEKARRLLLADRISHHLADVRNVPRYAVRYGMLALAILGAIQLWAARGDGNTPHL